MSANRQRPRTRVNSRANTLPINITATSDTTITTIDTNTNIFLPSIEESLQDWISRSIPDTPSSSISYLLDDCKCCGRTDCENLEALSSAIRKLDNDARLAAVIGQSLLQKHEQYVNESNEIKNGYQQEIDLLKERLRQLEQSLLESDTLNKQYLEENSKALWEWQKTQKALDETTADLDVSNSRCIQLGTELKAKINEVEKLRVFKFMARQADIREENLRAKLDDVKQELAISRKAELLLESKHKKLKTKYESICIAFEKLKMDQQEMGITENFQLDLVWLKESNEKLRKDVLKLTSALLSSNSGSDLQGSHNQNHLIELIKELASANNKLKSDLLDCTDLLMECRSDLYAKLNQSIEEEKDDIPLLKRTESKRSIQNLISKKDQEDITPSPQSSTSTPTSSSTVVHHHYHYYMRNKEKAKLNNKTSFSNLGSTENIKTNRVAPKPIMKIDSSSPFRQLYNQSTHLIQRLQQTDIRALNRRLRKTFDIFELSGMSNSIIENIVSDVDNLKAKFSWIEDKSLIKHEIWIHDVSMVEFFPIMGLLQDMLKEISQLRSTMNDLQVEYVKKVEASDIKLEEELLRKQKEQQKERQRNQLKSTSSSSIGALSWLTNMFQKLDPKEPSRRPTPDLPTHPLSKPIPAKPTSDPTIVAIRRQKSDIEKYGPPSSFPSRSYTHLVYDKNLQSKRRSTSTLLNPSCSSSSSSHLQEDNGHPIKPFSLPLRASQSAGTVRKPSSAISSTASPAAIEYAVRRKRSALGLSSSSSDYDLLSPQPTTAEMAGTFTTSWLGNK